MSEDPYRYERTQRELGNPEYKDWKPTTESEDKETVRREVEAAQKKSLGAKVKVVFLGTPAQRAKRALEAQSKRAEQVEKERKAKIAQAEDAAARREAFRQGRRQAILSTYRAAGKKVGAAQLRREAVRQSPLVLRGLDDLFLAGPPRRTGKQRAKPRPSPPVLDSLLSMGGGMLPLLPRAAPRAASRRSRATNDIDALLG